MTPKTTGVTTNSKARASVSPNPLYRARVCCCSFTTAPPGRACGACEYFLNLEGDRLLGQIVRDRSVGLARPAKARPDAHELCESRMPVAMRMLKASARGQDARRSPPA